MSATDTIVGVEEFLSNPDVHYYDVHELHHGEVVVVPPPSNLHVGLQRRIEEALAPLLQGTSYWAWREFYYVLASNSRRANVAIVLEARRSEDHLIFRGGPEIVIEVLSPSNSALDLDRLRVACFEEGTREFWIVNPVLRTVTVYRKPKSIAVYDEQQSLPLEALGLTSELSLSDVFQKQKG